MRARILLILSAAVLLVAVPNAGAAKSARQPLQVATTTFTQDGQQLTWSLELKQPFSPGALARDNRTLCLLIEGAKGGQVSAQVCVAGPRPGSGAPRLEVAPVTAKGVGSAHFITATVKRSSSRELSASFTPASIGIG